MKGIGGIGTTNCGGLRNVRPPVIDALYVAQGSWVCVCLNLVHTSDITTRLYKFQKHLMSMFYVTSVNNTI